MDVDVVVEGAGLAVSKLSGLSIVTASGVIGWQIHREYKYPDERENL